MGILDRSQNLFFITITFLFYIRFCWSCLTLHGLILACVSESNSFNVAVTFPSRIFMLGSSHYD